MYRVWAGKSPRVWVGEPCNKAWYGNEYGGFYVCPERVGKQAIVYSIGIGKDISFDQEMMEKHQARIFAFDPTPDSIEWVRDHVHNPLFTFLPYGIGAEAGEIDFYLPQNPQHVSGSLLATSLVDANRKVRVPIKRLADMVGELGHSHIDVLKMDIEGAEYAVIPDILQTLVSIGQILIEFHGRVLKHTQTLEAVQLLKTHGYEVFGISERGEEISFIKKSA